MDDEGFFYRSSNDAAANGDPAAVAVEVKAQIERALLVGRLAFALDGQGKAPVLALVCLGGNDMLRGLPPEQTRANLDAILTELKRRKIPVVLMGMLAPPNMGADYRAKFDPIYPVLARKHGARLVPFFMQPVLGKDHLIQPDHLHPNKTGVEAIVAATVGEVAGALPKPAAPPPPR